MAYRQPDRAGEEERQAKARADAAEVERVKQTLKSGTIWTPTLRRVTRGTLLVIVALVALVALSAAGRVVYLRFQPCRGLGARCIDATHLEMCEDGAEPTVAHCAVCSDRDGCGVIGNPMPGDACRLCEGMTGGGALPEEGRCSADRRIVMDCSGCFGLWRAVKACAPDEVCGPGGMEVECVKR